LPSRDPTVAIHHLAKATAPAPAQPGGRDPKDFFKISDDTPSNSRL
jgi:hypothetical protein